MEGWIGEGRLEHELLRAVWEIRLIVAPAAAALALVRATGKAHQRVPAPLAARVASHDQATQTAMDKAFVPAIPDLMHDARVAALTWNNRYDPERAIGVVVDGVDAGFEGSLVNHAADRPRHRRMRRRDSHCAMEQILDFNRPKRSRRQAGAGRRNHRLGAFRSLRKNG